MRHLSPIERLCFACEAVFRKIYLQMVVEGEGRLTAEKIASALNKVEEANKGLNLQLRGHLFWKKWVPCKSKIKIRVVSALEHKSIDPMLETPCEILLIHGVNTKVVFRASHIFMDARGLLHFGSEIFRALRGDLPLGSFNALNDFEVLKKIGAPRRIAPKLDYNSILGPSSRSVHSTFLMHELRVEGKKTALVQKIASILDEYGRKNGCNKTMFMLPTDLRPKLGNLNTLVNMSNPLWIYQEENKNWQTIFSEMLDDMQNDLEFRWENNDSLLSVIPRKLISKAIQIAVSYQHRKNRYLASGVLSSIGYISLASVSCENFLATRAYFTSVEIPLSPFSIVLTESGNSADLQFSVPNNLGDNGRLEEVVAYTKKRLGAKKSHATIFRGDFVELNDEDNFVSLFRSKAHKYPDKTSLVMDRCKVSYKELDRLSDNQARQLAQKGVKYQNVVAVCMDHSIRSIATILGILKLGSIYMPIDHRLPKRRVQQILESSKAHLLLSDEEEDKDLVPLDGYSAVGIKHSDIAYVIHTSGSTGSPKPISISHGNLLNYLSWAKKYYLKNEAHTFALFTSPAFDLTFTSIFLPLISGNSIKIFSSKASDIPLRQIICDKTISVLKLTPTHLRLLREMDLSNSFILKLIVGGEAFPAHLAKNIAKLLPNTSIFNEYGPTEATIGCIVHQFRPEVDTSATVPIGKPIQNIRIQVDSGEIIISGASLSQSVGGRKYRSGDMVNVSPDGNLVYLGRKDRQIKINAHRVELAEIEEALLEHPFIINSAVEVSENKIFAYIVSNNSLDLDEVKLFLAKSLPKYMIPNQFSRVSSLPQAMSGKLQFQSIEPETIQFPSNVGVDEKIKNIWKAVLKKNTLSDSDSFFDSGGNSLKLMILASRVMDSLFTKETEGIFKKKLPLFIHEPTIEKLESLVKDSLKQVNSSSITSKSNDFRNHCTVSQDSSIL